MEETQTQFGYIVGLPDRRITPVSHSFQHKTQTIRALSSVIQFTSDAANTWFTYFEEMSATPEAFIRIAKRVLQRGKTLLSLNVSVPHIITAFRYGSLFSY